MTKQEFISICIRFFFLRRISGDLCLNGYKSFLIAKVNEKTFTFGLFCFFK